MMMEVRMLTQRLASFARFQCTRKYSSIASPTNSEVRRIQNELFEKEKQRQLSLVTRVEKIEVKNKDDINPCTLIMNKGLSTPYHIAMHFDKMYRDRSALAVVNGEIWDMYRPLTSDCEVTLLHFKCDQPEEVNKAYWRACTHILGSVIDKSFKNDYNIELVNVPDVPVSAGCFCYDVNLNMDNWTPTKRELMCLSQEAFRLYEKSLPFERLEVDTNLALQIFSYNRYKQDKIEKSGKPMTTLYRCGDFVDLSDGPMVANTSFAQHYVVTLVHDIKSNLSDTQKLQRFQGVALPADFHKIHLTTWEPIEERASKPVYIDCDGPWQGERNQTRRQDDEKATTVSSL